MTDQEEELVQSVVNAVLSIPGFREVALYRAEQVDFPLKAYNVDQLFDVPAIFLLTTVLDQLKKEGF